MVTRINPNKVSVHPITWIEMEADAQRDSNWGDTWRWQNSKQAN